MDAGAEVSHVLVAFPCRGQQQTDLQTPTAGDSMGEVTGAGVRPGQLAADPCASRCQPGHVQPWRATQSSMLRSQGIGPGATGHGVAAGSAARSTWICPRQGALT